MLNDCNQRLRGWRKGARAAQPFRMLNSSPRRRVINIYASRACDSTNLLRPFVTTRQDRALGNERQASVKVLMMDSMMLH